MASQISIKKASKKEEGVITVAKELTIDNAKELSEVILKGFEQYPKLIIEAKNLSNIDLPGIQVIESTKKLAQENNKEIDVHISLDDAVSELLNCAGITL